MDTRKLAYFVQIVDSGSITKAAAALTPRIISEVGRRYPDIVLHVTEIYGGVLSEAIKNGRLDMALIYEPGPIRGVQFTTMIVEDLHFVVNANRFDVAPGNGEIRLEEVARFGLFLPEKIHTLRQVVEAGFDSRGLTLQLVGEVESVPSLARLLRADLGATIMPKLAADALFHEEDFHVLRIVDPALQCKIALCTPDHDPLSEAASAVLLVLKEMLQEMLSNKYAR